MIVYFRTYAKENGCPDEILNGGSDLDVWNWILVFQGKDPIEVM